MPGFYRPPYSSRPPGRHPQRSPKAPPRSSAQLPGFAPVPNDPGFSDSIETSLGQADLVASAISKLGGQLKTAIIEYVDRNGRRTTREVEPYEIRGGFLKTRCRVAQAPRSFELARVLSVQEGQPFEPQFPVQFELEEPAPVQRTDEEPEQ